MFEIIIQLLVLVLALSLDTFTACIAYGMNRIRIPVLSILILSGISSLTLGLSMLFGTLLSGLIHAPATSYIGFAILFILGLFKLFDRSCVGQAYKANKDNNNILSPKEAVSLSVAMSIDSVAAGIGAGIAPLYIPAAISASFLIGIIAIMGGGLIGRIISNHVDRNLCWISGLLLIFLAFMKLF